jgi:predicted RecB family nuclease
MAAKITRNVLESYLNCKYKGRLKLAGEEGKKSDYESMVVTLVGDIRTRGIKELLARHGERVLCGEKELTLSLLCQGASVFLDTTFEDQQLSLLYDGLVRVDGESQLGSFHYIPVLCCEGEAICRQDRLLLAILGLVLGPIQGRHPTAGLVIHGPGCERATVRLTPDLNRKAAEVLDAVRQLQEGGKPPTLTGYND